MSQTCVCLSKLDASVEITKITKIRVWLSKLSKSLISAGFLKGSADEIVGSKTTKVLATFEGRESL
jgi:hypothetical protein